jgi:hypothetical protein
MPSTTTAPPIPATRATGEPVIGRPPPEPPSSSPVAPFPLPLPVENTMRVVLLALLLSIEPTQQDSAWIVPSLPGADLIFSLTVGVILP